MARQSRKLATEFEEKADEYDGRVTPGEPADGDTWRIIIESRGSHAVRGEGTHVDAPSFEPLPNWVEVRAWSLSEALILAAGMPLDAWFDEEDD
jgi:hypothetical protein